MDTIFTIWLAILVIAALVLVEVFLYWTRNDTRYFSGRGIPEVPPRWNSGKEDNQKKRPSNGTDRITTTDTTPW